jgi:hypothetical protein
MKKILIFVVLSIGLLSAASWAGFQTLGGPTVPAGTAHQIQTNGGNGQLGAGGCTDDGSGNLNCPGSVTIGTIEPKGEHNEKGFRDRTIDNSGVGGIGCCCMVYFVRSSGAR